MGLGLHRRIAARRIRLSSAAPLVGETEGHFIDSTARHQKVEEDGWTMRGTTKAEDRCQGVLVGLTAGDQIGGPMRMAVRLAESLLDCGGFTSSDFLDRYLAWLREGAFVWKRVQRVKPASKGLRK